MTGGRTLVVTARIILAVAGGYLLSSGLVAAVAVGLAGTAIVPRTEAATLASMLGFPLFTAILIWAFSVRRMSTLLSMTAFGIAVLIVAYVAGSWTMGPRS